MSDSPVKKGPGRRKGSRNKTTLAKAQLQIDDLSLVAVGYLEALMRNDKDFLDCKDNVPYTVRFNAMKEILNKGIANEKEKELPKDALPEQDVDENGQVVHKGPQVYATAK